MQWIYKPGSERAKEEAEKREKRQRERRSRPDVITRKPSEPPKSYAPPPEKRGGVRHPMIYDLWIVPPR